MGHMSMVGIAYQNNHDLDQLEIVDLLVTGFSGTLRGWWDSYLTKESKDSIKHAGKKNNESLPIFYERIGRGIPDGVNTLIYIVLKHFVGTPTNVSPQISDYWIIWDVLLCLITDGIKMFLFPELCFGKIATSHIGKKSLLTVCLLYLLIR